MSVRNGQEFCHVRTARKRHRCDTNSYACATTIEPGQRYIYSTLPPNSDMGNERWWTARTCAPCAVAYNRPLADRLDVFAHSEHGGNEITPACRGGQSAAGVIS